MANEKDEFVRVYTTLSSLRKNIEQMGAVEEKYVREFHAVLSRLESIGMDVSEFRIPNSEVQPVLTAQDFGGSSVKNSYSEDKYVDKPYFLTKMDAILGYLEIITSEKPKKMGFSASGD